MNFTHVTKYIKLLCQACHRCGMSPILATADEIMENKKPTEKRNKGEHKRLTIYGLWDIN